ncbi:MAG: hypothetical protein U0Q03_10725 [Acidimicrobiales bacterium]
MGLLAHQGGWDEMLLIVGPMAVVVLLLRLAKRRVDRNLPAQPAASAPPVAPATPTTPTTPTDGDGAIG